MQRRRESLAASPWPSLQALGSLAASPCRLRAYYPLPRLVGFALSLSIRVPGESRYNSPHACPRACPRAFPRAYPRACSAQARLCWLGACAGRAAEPMPACCPFSPPSRLSAPSRPPLGRPPRLLEPAPPLSHKAPCNRAPGTRHQAPPVLQEPGPVSCRNGLSRTGHPPCTRCTRPPRHQHPLLQQAAGTDPPGRPRRSRPSQLPLVTAIDMDARTCSPCKTCPRGCKTCPPGIPAWHLAGEGLVMSAWHPRAGYVTRRANSLLTPLAFPFPLVS